MLAIVPLGSWYYLRSGLDYRKNALEELRAKYHVKDKCKESTYPNGFTTVLLDPSKSKDGRDALKMFKEVLEKEFDDVPKLHIYSTDLMQNEDSNKNMFVGCNSSEFQAITLIDTSGQVRMEYDGSEASFGKVIEHMAVVLPRQEEKDISQKNYK